MMTDEAITKGAVVRAAELQNEVQNFEAVRDGIQDKAIKYDIKFEINC